MGKVNEALYLLKEQLKEERDQRNLRLKELEKNTTNELASQRKFNEGKASESQSSTTRPSTTSRGRWESYGERWRRALTLRTRS